MTRVAHIITDLERGGAEMMLWKLLSRMDRSLIHSEVISLAARGPLAEKIEALQIKVHSLGLLRRRPNPLALLRLARVIRKARPQLVQTWLYHADLLGLLAARLADVPLVIWNIRCTELRREDHPRSLFWLIRLLSRLSPLPKLVVVNSEAGRVTHEALGYHPARWVVIPNGFDTQLFRADPAARKSLCSSLGIPEDAPLVGLVARFDPMKDHATFLAAAAELRRNRPEARFLLVGRGVETRNPFFAERLSSLGLNSSVHLLGERDDIPRITAAFDVATSSSSYGEGFSNAIGEAMACEVPCVVTDVGDSAALVDGTGFAVPPGSPVALAGGWRKLLDMGQDERRALGQAARERILSRFALEQVAKLYGQLYIDLALRARPSRGASWMASRRCTASECLESASSSKNRQPQGSGDLVAQDRLRSRATEYYAHKLQSLRDIFGTADVRLQDGRLLASGAAYPVVDDVIVLLDPSEYPPKLAERQSPSELASGWRWADAAESVQASFGEEWEQFPDILAEHEREFAQYFDLVDLSGLKDSRVCDLGCGIGRWSYFLRDRCRELVLVDFSDAIFVARESLRSAKNALFFMGDLRSLPFRRDFADFVFCLGVLHHLPADALDEVRRLKRFAPSLLVYLYYALENRPWHFRTLLRLVTAVRRRLTRSRSKAFRSALTSSIALGVYLPLVWLGKAFRPIGLGRHIPLHDSYSGMSLKRIRQDVYDRFFTPIEKRYSRQQIEALRDSFSSVRISEKLPYWHFLCRR